MLRIAVLLLSLVLLLGGAIEAYTSWKNPAPTRTTVADYAKSDKSKEWVVLTDAKINLLKAVTVTRKKEGKPPKLSKLYIPIESAEFTQNDTVSLLLDTDDEEILNVVRQIKAMSETKSEAAKLLQFLASEKDKLIRSVELSGRVASKQSMKSDDREEIRKLIKNLASDFYILDHNSTVSLTGGLIMMGIGLLMLTLFIFLLRRKKA